MTTLNLKTIATAILVTLATALASCSQNEPEIPTKQHEAATGNYLAVARLTVSDSIMPYVESVQVRYTLPGEAEKTETLSFRPMQDTDPEIKILGSGNVDASICRVAAFEKAFHQSGEVKMQLVLNVDTTRALFADSYETVILPLLAAGEPAGADKYAALKAESDLFHHRGIKADRLIEYILRTADTFSEMTFTLR